jgi:hypothetical protein
MMLTANGLESECGKKFGAEDEFRLSTVARMVKHFGEEGVKEKLALMAKNLFVQRIADLVEEVNAYIIIRVELRPADGGVRIVKMEEVVIPTDEMREMQPINCVHHPMLETAEGRDVLAEEEDLVFAQVRDGVVIFSTCMDPKWGTLKTVVQASKGGIRNHDSGWKGLLPLKHGHLRRRRKRLACQWKQLPLPLLHCQRRRRLTTPMTRSQVPSRSPRRRGSNAKGSAR